MLINCNDVDIDRDENYNIKDDDNGNDRENVFCLFKRVEQEKSLSPHELKTYSIYKHDTVDILILAVCKTCVIWTL